MEFRMVVVVVVLEVDVVEGMNVTAAAAADVVDAETPPIS
jgi:hypothetical protein